MSDVVTVFTTPGVVVEVSRSARTSIDGSFMTAIENGFDEGTALVFDPLTQCWVGHSWEKAPVGYFYGYAVDPNADIAREVSVQRCGLSRLRFNERRGIAPPVAAGAASTMPEGQP